MAAHVEYDVVMIGEELNGLIDGMIRMMNGVN